jgi:hypothetical protein
MGMFNDIDNFTEKCPKCGKELHFQTKDDTYDGLYLDQVDFRSVHYFYAYCVEDRLEIRYKLKEEWEKRTISDYERIVE